MGISPCCRLRCRTRRATNGHENIDLLLGKFARKFGNSYRIPGGEPRVDSDTLLPAHLCVVARSATQQDDRRKPNLGLDNQ
jgi:hypothetical protein